VFALEFWRATLERAVRAFAGSVVSVLVVGGQVADVRAVNWPLALGIGGGAALVSVLLSLLASQVGGTSLAGAASPSFVSDPGAAGKPPAAGFGAADERVGGHRGGPRPPGPPATP
jgi:r1t holin